MTSPGGEGGWRNNGQWVPADADSGGSGGPRKGVEEQLREPHRVRCSQVFKVLFFINFF